MQPAKLPGVPRKKKREKNLELYAARVVSAKYKVNKFKW